MNQHKNQDSNNQTSSMGPNQQPEEMLTAQEAEVVTEPDVELTAVQQLRLDLEQATDELKKAQEEVKQYQELCLRGAAEFENYKKRSLREKDALSAEVKAGVIAVLLPVVDSLKRAAEFAEGDEQSLQTGLQMVLRQLEDSFRQLGVETIEDVGHPFDPDLHNAVLHVEDETAGENMVVECLQQGYRIKEKVIRHSMVKVAN